MNSQSKPKLKGDLRNKEDIRLLIDTFYQRVKNDELLSPIINEKNIPNWSDHITVVCEFWEAALLNKSARPGEAAQKHLELPLTSHHFDRWVTLFHLTLDDLYAGHVAEEAKFQAHKMAEVFRTKLHLTRF